MTPQAPLAAIVLAAGLSSRMGRPKPLMPFRGRPALEQILSVLAAQPFQEILVVTGHAREAVESLVANWPARVVFNPHFAEGEMLSSVQVGLRALSPAVAGALVALIDQPALDNEVVGAVITAFRAGLGSVVVPSFEMRRGHPMLISRSHWDTILALAQGQSLRDFVRGLGADELHHVVVETHSVLQDLDTPEDWEAGEGV